MKRLQYLSAKYLAILESRHGEGFTAYVRRKAVAIHGAGDLHVEDLSSIIGDWRAKPLPVSPPVNPPSAPTPLQEWPRWARWLHKRRQSADRGVGDTLARILEGRGGAHFKRWFKAITGQDCGCGDRQARLNAQFSYIEENT